MKLLNFFSNQHYEFYSRMIFIFLSIAILIFIFILLKVKLEIKKSAIISSTISGVIVIGLIIYSSYTYNHYIEMHANKNFSISELGIDLSAFDLEKNLEESVMGLLKINYSNKNK